MISFLRPDSNISNMKEVKKTVMSRKQTAEKRKHLNRAHRKWAGFSLQGVTEVLLPCPKIVTSEANSPNKNVTYR